MPSPRLVALRLPSPLIFLGLAGTALAQAHEVTASENESPPSEAQPPSSATQATAPSTAPSLLPTESKLRLGAYAEAFYQWNFNEPSNGITHYRGFDNRHDSFTLSNVALDAEWNDDALVGRVTLQVGHTPSTYYLAEPSLPGAAGTNASSVELWKYVQQAYAGTRFDIGRGLTVTAGLFLSPIGPESMAVKDNWNWSRSNLFFGLPFYHTGIRAALPLTDAWELTLAGYNGWNSVVDNNRDKSISAQLTFQRPEVALSILYFGGVERATGAPEGSSWRHLLDAHVTRHFNERLSVQLHANFGLEPTTFGVSHWSAGALSGRVRVLEKLYVAVRADAFFEHVADSARGRASAIFWPVPWIASGTATLDFRPHERVSLRAEYRHDRADGDAYFGGLVQGDGGASPFVANRSDQSTVTLGATSWF